jgi:hypothetical protein
MAKHPNTIYAEVVSSETDSPAFKQSTTHMNPINEYTDQSLLRSDISSIYLKQERATRKTSSYREKRKTASRTSQMSKDKKFAKDKKTSRDKIRVKPNQSVASSQASKKKKKEKLLSSQIDKIGKIAKAMVDPRLLTLGQHVSISSMSKESLSLNGFQHQYQTQAQEPVDAYFT